MNASTGAIIIPAPALSPVVIGLVATSEPPPSASFSPARYLRLSKADSHLARWRARGGNQGLPHVIAATTLDPRHMSFLDSTLEVLLWMIRRWPRMRELAIKPRWEHYLASSKTRGSPGYGYIRKSISAGSHSLCE